MKNDENKESKKINLMNDAMKYFTDSSIAGGEGVAYKNAWKNVSSVSLPLAQDIADAANITGWDVNNASDSDYSKLGINSKTDNTKRYAYIWLYNYTRECNLDGCTQSFTGDTNSNGTTEAYGYWTQNKVYNDSTKAWGVYRTGVLYSHKLNHIGTGVRPVITLPKTRLVNN